MRRTKLYALAATALLSTGLIAGCGSSAPTQGTASKPVVLTLWQNYGTSGEAATTTQLAKAFEKTHPKIKINVVAEPTNNYFALFQAASISKTGPDIAVMWTGLYTLQYSKFLLNLNPYFPAAALNRYIGIQWSARNFTVKDGTYVIPFENQFYIGFYNKKLFREAGITQPPQDWAQFYQDCALLKAKGITPMEIGSTAGTAGAEFYPYYEFSYVVAGAYPLSQWRSLYDGKIPWTSPALVRQVTKWAQLYKDGYTNKDILTQVNAETQFAQGKAAMIVKGNWFLSTFEKALGSNLGVFVPPYSTKPMHSVVEFSGDGFAVTKYSSHIPQAVQFLKFLQTPQAQKIIVATGLIPDLKGVSTPDPLANQMLKYVAVDHYTPIPMLDNVTQAAVVNAASTQLDAAMAGDATPQAALQSMTQALQQIPPSLRTSTYQ